MGKPQKNFSIDWQRVNYIFFTYSWEDTFGIHSLHNESTMKYVALRPEHLFIEFSFEAPATEDIKHVCDRQTYHWLCKKNTPTNLSECDYFPVTQCLLIWAHINVDSLNVKYRKISKISPWAYIFTGTLSRAYIRGKGELLWFSDNLRGNRSFWGGLQKGYIYVQKKSSSTCFCCI